MLTVTVVESIICLQTDIPDIPGIMEGSIVRFDYNNVTERKIAYLYRQHEVSLMVCVGESEQRQVPFMVYNVPEVDAVVRKWTVWMILSADSL
jgi:hypothetical protein